MAAVGPPLMLPSAILPLMVRLSEEGGTISMSNGCAVRYPQSKAPIDRRHVVGAHIMVWSNLMVLEEVLQGW